ncbi:MAG: DMT family transporter [Thiobacillaceae bacterium]|nr:DMT family transporter [Thiobacillaceae bacterium]MDW8323545.1 DMT family transporter [Burkholderiales bacterium]
MSSAWMLLAGLSFALMGVAVKLGTPWFSSHELVFYRSAFGLILVLGAVTLHDGLRGLRALSGAHLGLHVRRGLIGFAALATYFYSLTRLPLSMAVTLNYTSPLFLALLAPLTLGERLRAAQITAVALGFAGVVLLLRPWQAQAELAAGLIGLASGLLAGLAYVHVRALGRHDEPEWRTVFWFSAISTLGAAALASAQGWQPAVAPHWALLLGMGLAATVGQLAMTRAYRKGHTAVVAAFAYSTVIFATLLDVIIWQVRLPPVAWLGIALTVAAGVWAAILNVRTEGRA